MSDEEFMAHLRRNAERYEEIRNLGAKVTHTASRYANTTYTVQLNERTRGLSDHDLIVLCDGGNACFGGKVTSRTGDRAYVTVYTD